MAAQRELGVGTERGVEVGQHAARDRHAVVTGRAQLSETFRCHGLRSLL